MLGGGMSQALFSSGTLCIAGFLMFASGTSIKINGLGSVIKRCAPTTIAKLAIGFAFGFAFIYFFGSRAYSVSTGWRSCR